MKRELLCAVLGAAMALALTGCTSGNAPDVTPVPTAQVTNTPMESDYMDKPMNTGDAHYEADNGGMVEGTTPPAGTTARGAMDKAGSAVRHAADDVKRDVEHMVR